MKMIQSFQDQIRPCRNAGMSCFFSSQTGLCDLPTGCAETLINPINEDLFYHSHGGML